MTGDTTREIKVPLDEALGQASLDLTRLARWLIEREKTAPAGAVSMAIQANVKRMDATAEALRELAKEVNGWPKEAKER